MNGLSPRERYERDIHLLVLASRASPELREAVRTVENHVRTLEADPRMALTYHDLASVLTVADRATARTLEQRDAWGRVADVVNRAVAVSAEKDS